VLVAEDHVRLPCDVLLRDRAHRSGRSGRPDTTRKTQLEVAAESRLRTRGTTMASLSGRRIADVLEVALGVVIVVDRGRPTRTHEVGARKIDRRQRLEIGIAVIGVRMATREQARRSAGQREDGTANRGRARWTLHASVRHATRADRSMAPADCRQVMASRRARSSPT
jgi:hypothetical protein